MSPTTPLPITGKLLENDGATRIVQIQHVPTSYYVIAPSETTENITIGGDQGPTYLPEQWQLICTSYKNQTYQIQSMANSADYAWVSNTSATLAGTNVTLQTNKCIWTITESTKTPGQYTICNDGTPDLFWTVNGTDLGSPVLLEGYSGLTSTFAFFDPKTGNAS